MALPKRSRRWGAAVIAAGLVGAMVLVAPAATAAPSGPSGSDNGGYTPAVPGPVKSGFAKPVGKLAGGLDKKKSGTVRVFVQFAGTGAARAARGVASQGVTAQKSAAGAKRSAIASTATAVLNTAKQQDRGASEIYTLKNSIPGVAISVDAKALAAIAARHDVVKVTTLVPKKINNAGAAQFTKVLNAWQDTGVLGEGVSVGVIDTGIDYTHADFGGAGTVAAFDAAKAAEDQPFTPTAKVVGGYDFVGNSYNADPTADPNGPFPYQPNPEPDNNPIDCNGHGTHVSGTVAGLGVDADGNTFNGDYTKLTGNDLYDMRIGPGMAPAASLYGLKVFGCEGSTDVTSEALDWALDPNGDGDFSDHLDIVNLSLGSDYGVEDDPDNAVVDMIAEYGVLSVIAMGNAGDSTDAGGTPGNATRSLAVASVVDPFQLKDGLTVDAPAALAGVVSGQNSVAYDWKGSDPVSGSVVAIPGPNADGCSAYSAAEKAAVDGKIAWVEWDDNDATRRCGSVARGNNAVAAGAIGVIFTSQLDAFGAGITGSATIPVFQLGGSETAQLRPALEAGTLKVTFENDLTGVIKDVKPALGDTISGFSSRGTHGAKNPVKPDVAAPGSTITSAGIGTGNDQLTISGTSMATPHTAGIAALVKAQNPSWTTEQIKADIMNTATHDVFTKEGQTGLKYGPARVGAGRVDALDAVTNDLLAYSADVKGGVSATFGVVWVPASTPTMTATRTITVQNTGRTGKSVATSYEPVITTPGVTYTTSPANVYVRPKGTATVTVTMNITTAKLQHTIDPTMAVTTTNPDTGLDEPRQYVTDASGRVLLKQVGKTALRVPVYGVPRAWATTKAGKGTVGGKPALTLTGQGVSGSSPSLVSALQLGGTSPRLPKCSATVTAGCYSSLTEKAGDIYNVGVASTKGSHGYSDGFLWFSIGTYLNWATVGHTLSPYVDIDVNNDFVPDYEVYAQAASTPSGDGTDLIEAYLVDLNAPPSQSLISITPINFNYGDVDTGAFDARTILLPVDPAAIGITPTTSFFRINYVAATYNSYTGQNIDVLQGAPYNVVRPRILFDSPIYQDQGGTAIPYTLGAGAKAGDQALVVHLNGAPGGTARTNYVTVK